MNFENIFTPYNARKLTEADVPDILGLYLENNAKKYQHRKAARLKKRAAIPQTSCTHRCELQLSFYAVWFIRDLPLRGIKVNLIVSASFLDSNRYGSAPFTLILDFPLIISITV